MDNLSDQHRLAMEKADEYDSDEESESEEESEDSAEHEVELISIARRRVIRNSEGSTINSYKDLAIISKRNRQPRRQLNLAQQSDTLLAAERGNVEFD